MTASLKGSEAEQGNWIGCSQEVSSHLRGSVSKFAAKPIRGIKPELTKLQEKFKVTHLSLQFCTKPHSQNCTFDINDIYR